SSSSGSSSSSCQGCGSSSGRSSGGGSSGGKSGSGNCNTQCTTVTSAGPEPPVSLLLMAIPVVILGRRVRRVRPTRRPS
ncbi:MAG TPA: hypothetical protein VIY73_11020, partial [Polyangiaceae bacterium]